MSAAGHVGRTSETVTVSYLLVVPPGSITVAGIESARIVSNRLDGVAGELRMVRGSSW